MDENNEALNPQDEGNIPAEPPADETKPTEATVEPTEEPTGEADKETEAEGKRSASARIRELNAEKKEFKEKYESLSDQMAKLTGVSPESSQTPQQPPMQTEGTVTPEQYEQDVLRKADYLVQLRIKQQTNIDRVNREANDLTSSYKQLDPNHENFDKELSESISEAALSYVKANPTGSVKRFVDNLMKPYLRSISKEVGEAEEHLARQVSEAALKPTLVAAKEKQVEEMSIKELEDRLGVTQA